MRWTELSGVLPAIKEYSEDIPDRAREFLIYASISVSEAPPLAVTGVRSAIEAMLANKGYVEGTLWARIEAAKEASVITPELAEWGHILRDDGNESTHTDADPEPLADSKKAREAVDLAEAFAKYLYELPAFIECKRNKTK